MASLYAAQLAAASDADEALPTHLLTSITPRQRSLRRVPILPCGVLFRVGKVKLARLEKIAGKCVSMSVAIHPASLWTQYMFAAITRATGRVIDLGPLPDLRAELQIWLGLSATL